MYAPHGVALPLQNRERSSDRSERGTAHASCLPASACEFVRPFALLLSVSPRTQVSTTFPVMALCKAEITRHGHTRRTWNDQHGITCISRTLRSRYIELGK